MSALPKAKMTVDEFLIWSDSVDGRYELLDGVVHRMQSERARHAERKFAVQMALRGAIRAKGAPFQMLPDGMTVRIDEHTAYEPDALVYCGDALDDEAVEVPAPVIVVDVLLPSTGQIDTGRKLIDYFKLPSVIHYIIVNPAKPPVVHHARQSGGMILTRLAAAGELSLDPPGICVTVEQLFEQI
ncbi:MAG: Uma2 family endonuclease [Hyphomicrobiales bacterium]|nr:Uma2 family endonuclease [Hyphomicrobiales bacterium]